MRGRAEHPGFQPLRGKAPPLPISGYEALLIAGIIAVATLCGVILQRVSPLI